MPFYRKPKTFVPLQIAADERAHKNGLRASIFTQRGGLYKGEWKHNKKHGKGFYLSTTGKLYEGDWFLGFRHGHGVLSQRCPNGTYDLIYRGEWVRGKEHGVGWYYYSNGDIYNGFWKEGVKVGFGRMWYRKDGEVYVGYWKDNKRHGLGLYVYRNHNRYEGMWENDKRHGPGRYFHLDSGQLQCGVWEDDFAVRDTITDMITIRQSCENPTELPIPELEKLGEPKVDKWDKMLARYMENVDSKFKKCIDVCSDPWCQCCLCGEQAKFEKCCS